MRALMLGVVVFQREQEGLVRISGKGPDIFTGGKRAVPPDEGVVHLVEEPSGFDDFVFRRVVELGLEHLPHGVADGHHAADAVGGSG